MLFVLLVSLVLAGCSSSPAVAPEPELRTAEVFDTEAHRDKLTVRYFFLDSEEKSGDAILLQTPDGLNIMIDSGIPATSAQLENYLEMLGVTRIDYAINTHPHYDHMGGYTSLLKTKEIGGFYMPNFAHTTETYRTVMNLIAKHEIPLHFLEDGDQLLIGEHVTIDLLGPEKGTAPDKYDVWATEHINNHSLILKLSFGDTTFLFTGDLYKSGEFMLIDDKGDSLDVDMVHAPHHGDNTSSSIGFVQATSPQIAIMSANIFQSLDVKSRYERNGALVASTGLHGNLLLVSDGKDITLITEKELQ